MIFIDAFVALPSELVQIRVHRSPFSVKPCVFICILSQFYVFRVELPFLLCGAGRRASPSYVACQRDAHNHTVGCHGDLGIH